MLTVAMDRRGGIQAMSAGGNGFGDEGVLVPLKKMQKTNVGAAHDKV